MKRVLNILGILSFLIGAVFLFNSFSGITGFVVIKDFGKNISSSLGIVFILVGLALMMGGKGTKKKYRVRREKPHTQGSGGGYHAVVCYRGKRTNLNATMQNGRIYIGNHGRGIFLNPTTLGKVPLETIAEQTYFLLKSFDDSHATASRGKMKNVRDITNYL